MTNRRVLRVKTVLDLTGVSRATLYRLIRAQQFPKPIALTGVRAVGWDSQAVESWIESRINSDPLPTAIRSP